MNSDSFTTRRGYGLPPVAASAAPPTARLDEPSGSHPPASLAGSEREVSEGETANESGAETADDEGPSIAELTNGLLAVLPTEEEEGPELAPMLVPVHFAELASEADAASDDAEDTGEDFLGGLALHAEELESEGLDEAGELAFHFGFDEAPQDDLGEGAAEDPLDAAALFGSSGFASELPALDADEDGGEPVIDAAVVLDELSLPRRSEFVVERRIPGACSAVGLDGQGDFISVHPLRLVHYDERLEPLWDVEIPSGIVHAAWCDRQVIVLQGDGELVWLRPSRQRGWQTSQRVRLPAPCRNLLTSQQHLLVVTDHGRCARVTEGDVQWLDWPDRLLAGGSGDPAALLASGRLGPYLVFYEPACGELSAGPPLLDNPPQHHLALATLGPHCWVHGPGAGVWHSESRAHPARRLRGYGQVCALSAGRDGQQPAAWLALDVEHAMIDVVHLPADPEAAAVVARVELAGDEPSVDAITWDSRSERLFICSDEALLVLRRVEPSQSPNPSSND